MSISTTVRTASVAIGASLLVACSGGGGGGDGGAAAEGTAEAPAGDDKALLMAALTEMIERPEATYRAVTHSPSREGDVQLSNCATVSWAESGELVETTISYPNRGAFGPETSDCEADWVRQRLVYVGDGTLLTETYDGSVSGDPWPSRGWRECRSVGDLGAQQAAASGSGEEKAMLQLVEAVEAAGPVERSSVDGLPRLTADIAGPGGIVNLTVEVTLDDDGDLLEMGVERQDGDHSSTTALRFLPAVPPQRPSDAEVEEVVEVATPEERERCADYSQPAGGS